jgi:hypothetical protein
MVRQTDQMGPVASIMALIDPPRFACMGPGKAVQPNARLPLAPGWRTKF